MSLRTRRLILLHDGCAEVLVEADGRATGAGCALTANTAQGIEAIYKEHTRLVVLVCVRSLTLLVAADTGIGAAWSSTCSRAHMRQGLTETASDLDQVRRIRVRGRSVATFL